MEVRQAAKQALRKLFPFIDLANVSEMCIASLTERQACSKKKIPDIIVRCDIRFQICSYILAFYQQLGEI